MNLFRDGLVSSFAEDRGTSYSHKNSNGSTSTYHRGGGGRWESLKGSCPICNGAHKSCKINGELILCRDDVQPVEYRNLGESNLAGFYKYLPEDNIVSFTAEKREEYRRERERLEAERLAQYKASLSESDRHEEISKLLPQLSLSSRHRENLKSRGFADAQIEAIGFRSVEKWQRLESPINPNLAGINSIGKGMTCGGDAILLPIKNHRDEYIGWQYRQDDGDARYKWAASKANKNRKQSVSSHLQNGEWPLSYCQHTQYPTGIGISEGTKIKPDLIALKHNQIVIGAASGFHYLSPEQLKEQLEAASAITETKIVTLWPDAGACSNRGPLAAYSKSVALIQSWGFKVMIAWYGQTTKGIHLDPDEYEGENYQLLDWSDWVTNYCSIKTYHQKSERKTLTADEFWERFGPERAIAELQQLVARATYKFWKRTGELPEKVGLSGKAIAEISLLEAAEKLRALATEKPLPALPPKTKVENIIEFDGESLPDLSERSDNTVVKIRRGDLKKAIASVHTKSEQGAVGVLNLPTGTGKSHDIGELSAAELQSDIFYLHSQWRNPTVATIERNYEPVASKHGGLKFDNERLTEDGLPYVRHIKEEEEFEVFVDKKTGEVKNIDTPANCQYFGTFQAARALGIKLFGGKGSANCETCDKYKTGNKVTCPALLSRILAFSNKEPGQYRTHPINLPKLTDKINPLLILDEADKELPSVSLERFSVAPGDIWAVWGDLNAKNQQLAKILQPLTEKLAEITANFSQRYGFSLASIKECLSLDSLNELIGAGLILPNVDITRISVSVILLLAKEVEKLLEPDLFELFQNCNDPKERKQRVIDHVRPNWISPLLRALVDKGSVRVDAAGLHFVKHSNFMASKASQAGTTILASASNHPGDLAMQLKYPAKRMIRIELIEPPTNENLTVKIVEGMQLAGDRRSEGEDSVTVRLQYLLDKIITCDASATGNNRRTYGIIDRMKYRPQKRRGINTGYWHSDYTRGGNHFKGVDCLILIDSPFPNIGDSIADYEALSGRTVDTNFSSDRRFLAYLNRQKDAEQIIQGIGRLRNSRRPDKQLECWVIADRINEELIHQTYPGAKVEKINLLEFCPAAAKTREQKIWQLAQYLPGAIASDELLTRDKVAKSLGFSAGNLSKIVASLNESLGNGAKAGWKRFLDSVTSALRNTICASDGTLTPEMAWFAETYLPAVFEDFKAKEIQPVEVFEVIDLVYQQYGPSAGKIFAALPTRAAIEFVDFLMCQFGLRAGLEKWQEELLREYGFI